MAICTHCTKKSNLSFREVSALGSKTSVMSSTPQSGIIYDAYSFMNNIQIIEELRCLQLCFCQYLDLSVKKWLNAYARVT